MLKSLWVLFKQFLSLINSSIFSIIIFMFLALPVTRALPGTQDKAGKYSDNDNLSPDHIHLAITDLDDGIVVLRWTAPGDDGHDGQAEGYDLRYQLSQLGQIDTEEEWLAADQVDDEPQPSPAGQIDSMIVTGLETGASYYFCIKAYDEADNYSGLSNSPFKTAFDPGYIFNMEIIGCGVICLDPANDYYQYGDTVAILAEPCENWEFNGWSGDFDGSDNPITVVVNADINITATFITDFIPGDANGNGILQVSDVLYLVYYFIGINPPPNPFLAGDANGDCQVISGDVTYLVNYMMGTGEAPVRGDCE